MSDSQDAFMAALATGKYSKTWLTNKMKQMQEHESHMGLLAIMREDEEMKYWLGVTLGSAAAVLGAMVTGDISAGVPGANLKAGPGGRDPAWPTWGPGETRTLQGYVDLTNEVGGAGHPQKAMQGWFRRGSMWVYVPEGYLLNTSTGRVMTREEAEQEVKLKMQSQDFLGLGKISEALEGATDLVGLFKTPMSMVGLGFAGWNASILIFKSIFGKEGLNEIGVL